MTEFLKGQPHVIDRDTIHALLQRRWDDTTGGGKEPGVSWVLNQLADVEVLAFREPVDDPAKDAIGTVRREDHHEDGGHTAWQVWANQYGDRTWRVSWSTHPVYRSFLRGDKDMVGCPVIGAAPGTPAWEKQQVEVEHTDMFEPESDREPRVFSSDGPEPPADVKAVEWLDRSRLEKWPYVVRVGSGWRWSTEPDRVSPEREGPARSWSTAVSLSRGTFREVFPA